MTSENKAHATAVVFAYHNVGVACLKVLLAANSGVDVKLVVSHQDSETENIWFDCVADLARSHGISVVTPDNPNTDDYIRTLDALKPDFIFSFYYRHMLKPNLLATAKLGAFNMHGSLLPKYRGRVPINWAIIHGETETGVTLHEMVEKPDAGRIAGQRRIPIGEDDTAKDVFDRATIAAGELLRDTLPAILDSTVTLTTQNLNEGSYFGGRRPEDGVINWQQSAREIHNLVRAVAPPYPGATTQIAGERVVVTKTKLSPAHFRHQSPGILNVANDMLIACCGDGAMLRILEATIDGMPHNEVMLAARFGVGKYQLISAE
jgi:methionyl-tRNA formyltransferase